MSSPNAATSPSAKSHSRKKSTSGTTASATSTSAVAKRDGPAAVASKLPSILRFPLVFILNLSLSSLLYSLSAEYLTSDLAEASRRHDAWQDIGLILCARKFELGISWFGGFDSYDLASLTLLTHFPVLYLLTYFYEISTTTLITSLAIDCLSAFLPFHLLRPVAPAHAPRQHHKNAINNRLILDDPVILVATSLGAAGVYAAALLISFRSSSLTVLLAEHFDGLRTLRPAHELQYLTLLLTFVPLGFAARILLFVPSTGTKPDDADARRKHFKPATASFRETVVWNLWGWTARERELIKRSAVLIGLTQIFVACQTAGTIKGTDWAGASEWASIWAVAAAGCGALFWWVEKAGETKTGH